jgi:hypothetical protein
MTPRVRGIPGRKEIALQVGMEIDCVHGSAGLILHDSAGCTVSVADVWGFRGASNVRRGRRDNDRGIITIHLSKKRRLLYFRLRWVRSLLSVG